MYLTPTEEDRLRVFMSAELARRARARGLPLNAPEAVALACDAMHAAARLCHLIQGSPTAGPSARIAAERPGGGSARLRCDARGGPRWGFPG